MASGHRKRKAAILRSELLNDAGYTNVAEDNRGDPAQQNSLMNFAIYSPFGYAPPISATSVYIENMSRTVLSDAESNGDGVWTLLGYKGETDANSSGFLNSDSYHTAFWNYPGFGTDYTAQIISGAIVIYSIDGPKANFNSYYTPSSQRTSGTASINLGTSISGAAAGNPKLKVYIAGAMPTGAIGSVITVTTGTATPLITYTSSSANIPLGSNGALNFDAVTASFSTRFPTAISGNQPVSGDKISITLPVGYGGLTQTASYTITLTSSLSPTASGNNMYISGGAGNINFTGSTFHSILRQGINGTAITNTSSLGSGFLELANYISASSATAGVSLFATKPSKYGYQIAVSGSNNKIKKVAGVSYFRYEPYYVEASFNTASMGNLIITYSSSADTYNQNSFSPGFIIYITGSAT